MPNMTRSTAKAVLASAILAALSAGAACTPATAQATAPKGIPFTCVTGDATASSQWVNQGGSLILDLVADPPSSSITPAVGTGSNLGQAGVLVENIGLPLNKFSFDYQASTCGGENAAGLLVTVHSTDGWMFYQYCNNFDAITSRNGWHHIVFTRDEMFSKQEKPLGEFERISIDLFNYNGGTATAQVKNFAIDGFPVIRVTKQSLSCVSL